MKLSLNKSYFIPNILSKIIIFTNNLLVFSTIYFQIANFYFTQISVLPKDCLNKKLLNPDGYGIWSI